MQLWWSPYLWTCLYLDVPTLKQEVEPFPPAQLWNGFEFSTISWYSTSRCQTIYFQTINQRDVGEVILNTSVSFFLHSSYLGWKLSEQEEAGSISISVFFFCFFFLASSPVTCLTFHPINSRTTSRTAGAKVVPLEPQTDKPAGSWLRVRAGVTAWWRDGVVAAPVYASALPWQQHVDWARLERALGSNSALRL